MNLLLDSHVLLWWSAAQELSAQTVLAIENAASVAVSLVTPWELRVKANSGWLDVTALDWFDLEARGIALLIPTLPDVLLAADLPLHHRDPFDRLIIAQALQRDLVIVTRDRDLARYGVPILAA